MLHIEDSPIQTRDSSAEQAWLIERMIAAGCDARIVEEGVCSGLNRAAVLFSVLVKSEFDKQKSGIELFKQLLSKIQALSPKNIATEIAAIKEENTLTIAHSEQDILTMSIMPFFNLICALQDLELHKKDFPNNKIFSLISNMPLLRDYLIEEPTTMLTQIALLTGVYTADEVEMYFSCLSAVYSEFFSNKNKPYPTVILWLGNSQHFTTILLNEKSIIINANDKNIVDDEFDDVANKTMEAFSGEDTIVYSTRLFCAPQDENILQEFYTKLQENSEWKKIHEITKKKLRMADDTGTTWLHISALENDLPVLEKLLENGANPNKGDEEDYTPLHSAAGENHVDAVRILVKHLAKLNCVTMHGGHTPLQLAVSEGHAETVKLLLDLGANPNVKNDDRKNALSMADLLDTPKRISFTSLITAYDVDGSDADSVSPMSSAATPSSEMNYSPLEDSPSLRMFSPTKQSFNQSSLVNYSGVECESEDEDDFECETNFSSNTGSILASMSSMFPPATPVLDSDATEVDLAKFNARNGKG